MENDISVDVVGISPRHPGDQTNSDTRTFQNRNSFPIKDQQDQNNYLPPDTRNITSSPEQHGYYQSQSENDSENIYVRQVRHKEKDKDLGDVDIAHTKDETEIKTPQYDLSMSETQETQLSGVGNYDNQDRQVHTSNQQKELCLPPSPPLDWRLNELLDCIATNVDETELKRIKLMFTGPNGIGKGVLEKCDSCLELLTLLKQRGYISRDNILYLNKLLYVLQRHDLLQKTVEYCVNEGDVIHYYSVDRQPDVGEKQIKVHVKADVQNYHKEQLDRLRNVVANIVCVPAEEILIMAVAPGSSLPITFTMPKMYVDIVQSLLEKKVNLQRLTAIDVDIIIIGDKQYDVTGHDAVIDVSEQCKELMNVYKQLENTTHELEKMEIIKLNCQKELEEVSDRLKKAESKISELAMLCSRLQSMHFTYGVKESSIENFQQLMTEASNKEQDKEPIKRIIRTNTEIVAACHRNRNELEQQEKDIKLGKDDMLARCGKAIELDLISIFPNVRKQLQEQRSEQDDFMFNKRIMQLLEEHTKTAEEIIIMFTEKVICKVSPSESKKINSVLRSVIQKCKELCFFLNENERKELLNMNDWPNDDVVRSCIYEDIDLLIFGVWIKHIEQTNEWIPPETFLAKIQRKLKRSDLPNLYVRMLNATEDVQQMRVEYLKEKMLKESNLLLESKKRWNKKPEDPGICEK